MMMMLRSLSALYVTLFTAAVVTAQPTLSPTMADSPADTMDDGITPPPTGSMPPTNGTTVMDPTLTLEEIIMSNSDLTTLALAVNVSDIFSAVDPSAGFYTLFAPNDAAFTDVDPKFLEPNYILHLRGLLAYHVTNPTPEALFSTDLMDGMVLGMLNGDNVTLDISGDVSVEDVFGNDATVVVADVAAIDGTLHVIDEILTPTFLGTNLIELASQVEDLSILAELMTASKADALIPSGDFTILAPSNEAMLALGNETLEMLFNNSGLFLSIVINHVVPGVYPSVVLSDGAMVKTAGGANLTVSVAGGMVMINDATVIQPDILASNGIVHIIDQVIMIEMPDDSMPSMSPVPAVGMPSASPVPAVGMPSASPVPSYSLMPSTETADGPPLGPMSVPPVPGPTPMPVAQAAPVGDSTSGAFQGGTLVAIATVFFVAFLA